MTNPDNAEDRIADMSADDMLAEMAIETNDKDWLPPGYEDELMEILDAERDILATITGRFCEPGLKLHINVLVPEKPTVAEGRFEVSRWSVFHDPRTGADVSILLDDDGPEHGRPLSNVAIYLSFDHARKLAEKILAAIPGGEIPFLAGQQGAQ
jgi:hypothetical protein